MYFWIIKVFRISLKEDQWTAFVQFVRFGIVGLSNTLIHYVVYAGMVAVGINYIAASVAGFSVSVINAFFWNNRFVFRKEEGEKRSIWKVFFKTFCSYAGTGLILENILLVLWIEVLKVPEIAAPVISLLITIPLNFLLNKFWAFRK